MIALSAPTRPEENGLFVLRVPDPGSYRLRAGRIGYASFTTEAFTVEPGRSATVDLRLWPNPLLLDSLEAVVEGRQPSRLVRVGFYKRRARGFGYFLTPEDIEDRRAVYAADLFWGIPGIRVVQRNAFDWFVVSTRWSGPLGGPVPCIPAVSIDGLVIGVGGGPRDSHWQDLVNVHDIEALEVYPGVGGVPAWVPRRPCGAILFWTKGSLR